MTPNLDGAGDTGVLQSKRVATIYQILVEIAERQPAVSQREIADEIGVTSQAVSDYLQELVAEGYVDKQGRGRYEITKEGVDWVISQTDALEEFVDHVASEVLDNVDVETAVATTDIAEGQTVTLAMHDGVLQARQGETGSATAVAVTDAEAGQDVGVTNFEGVIDYDLGRVTVVSIPPVQDGGSSTVDADNLVELAEEHDVLAVDGTEGLVAARNADLSPDFRFGTVSAVREAATKGLDVLLLTTSAELSKHTDALSEYNVSYVVIDSGEDR